MNMLSLYKMRYIHFRVMVMLSQDADSGTHVQGMVMLSLPISVQMLSMLGVLTYLNCELKAREIKGTSGNTIVPAQLIALFKG